jgi:hypothetical protein
MTAAIGASTEPTVILAGVPIGTVAMAGDTVMGGAVGTGPVGAAEAGVALEAGAGLVAEGAGEGGADATGAG